jgi:hypothetical protein
MKKYFIGENFFHADLNCSALTELQARLTESIHFSFTYPRNPVKGLVAWAWALVSGKPSS